MSSPQTYGQNIGRLTILLGLFFMIISQVLFGMSKLNPFFIMGGPMLICIGIMLWLYPGDNLADKGLPLHRRFDILTIWKYAPGRHRLMWVLGLVIGTLAGGFYYNLLYY